MPTQKLIGCPAALWGEPIVKSLRSQGRFGVQSGTPSANAHGLRDGRLDAAFVSPIDYAREGSLDRIVPGIAVSSQGACNAVVLRFREGIKTISSLAVDPSSVSDIILARILLAEEFEVTPAIVPVEHPEDMLRRADAALLSGDQVFHDIPGRGKTLDLVEMWTEMTDLPYVHGTFCCREHALTDEEAQSFGSLLPHDRPLDIASDVAAAHGFQAAEGSSLESFFAEFSFELNDEVREGLTEFLKYSYYHGILPDVPDLHFYSAVDESAADTLLN